MADNLQLYPPATNLYRQIEAFFLMDDDITVKFERDKNLIEVYVKGQAKADALAQIMVDSVTFGNETVAIDVIPDNGEEGSPEKLVRDAFFGNPIVDGIITTQKYPKLAGSTHVMFEKRVVQYQNDDISDLNGMHSTLYQYLAKKIFKELPGIFYNTSVI